MKKKKKKTKKKNGFYRKLSDDEIIKEEEYDGIKNVTLFKFKSDFEEIKQRRKSSGSDLKEKEREIKPKIKKKKCTFLKMT